MIPYQGPHRRVLQPVQQTLMDVVEATVGHDENQVAGSGMGGQKVDDRVRVWKKIRVLALHCQVIDQLPGGTGEALHKALSGRSEQATDQRPAKLLRRALSSATEQAVRERDSGSFDWTRNEPAD